MSRIVVFTGELSYPVRRGIVELADALGDVRLLVVIHRPTRRLSALVSNQRKNLKRNGWRWIPHVAAELVGRIWSRGARRNVAKTSVGPGSRFADDALVRLDAVETIQADDLSANHVLGRVRDFRPDLGVSLAAPILSPALFSIPRLGTLNLHKGRVPEYRGMPPAFWELWHGEKTVGCTVHVVEETLDTGSIVRKAEIPVHRHSTLRGLQLTLDDLGVRLMTQAARAVLDGTVAPEPQRPGGRTFRKPTLLQQKEFRQRFVRSPSRLRHRAIAKDVWFGTYSAVGILPRYLRAKRGEQRVVVLLYHRVNDELRDSLTIGIEHFDSQMAYLARTCCVVDIHDVLSGKFDRSTHRPVVAVTFDDGYRDNYENAAPILLRHRVPAAFFVSTGKIGVNGPFEHDVNRLGRSLPTMDWDQLREMKSQGFTIGSHSVSHLDCGSADLELVRAELRESKDVLAERLDILDPVFAYPFGGRRNMTAKALELVRAEGYLGCLSAYGGRNVYPIDPFNIMRVGIDDNFTERSFRARLEGWS